MNHVLLVVSGPEGLGEKLNFVSDRPFVVGREMGCDAVFSSDSLLSSSHFSILASNFEIYITDLASTNGTFINGARISKSQAYPGDQIRAGSTIFEIQTISKPLVSPAVHRGPLPNDEGYDRQPEFATAEYESVIPIPASRPDYASTPAFRVELSITTESGERKSVHQGGVLTIGRTDLAAWSFPNDLKMSSEHFAVQARDNLWELRDCSSTNGTFLNHKRVNLAPLHDGDTIDAGSTRFSITIRSEPIVPTPPIAPLNPNKVPLPPLWQPRELTRKPIADHAGNIPISISTPEPPQSKDPQLGIRETTDWISPLTKSSPPQLETGRAVASNLITPLNKPRFRITLHCLTTPSLTSDYEQGQEILIGRSPHNDASFPIDPLISSSHAKLRVLDARVVLEDLDSTNGTFVNGVRIREEILLHGTRFTIGNQQFAIAFAGQEIIENLSENREKASEISNRVPLQTELDSPLPITPNPINKKSDRLPILSEGIIPIAEVEIPFESYPCGSGLVLFGGCLPAFDPIDIARRLTLATPGWLVHTTEVGTTEEQTHSAGSKKSLNIGIDLISADDPSWMIPWSKQWGKQETLVLYSRSDQHKVMHSLQLLCDELECNAVEIPPHKQVLEFLANRLSDRINKVFAPLDAVLIELNDGKQWAYIAPKDMEHTLKQLRFRRKHRW